MSNLTVQPLEKYSNTVQQLASIKQARRVICWRREGRERVELKGASAIGDGVQAAISLIPDVNGMHIRIFESVQFEGAHVGDLM